MTAPVLVLLNGLPASGKSTLARAWAERHGAGLPLVLDVDVLRGLLGGWREHPTAAGLAARAAALAAAEVHLGAGRDVVVPQHLRRPEFAEALQRTARQAGAAFLECVVAVAPEEAERRFLARSVDGGGATEGPLEPSMAGIASAFAAFLADRPGLVVLEGDPPILLDALDAAAERARSAAG